MSLAVTLNNVATPGTGAVEVTYNGGQGLNFSDRSGLSAQIDQYVNEETMVYFLLYIWRERNPAMNDPELVNGLRLELNPESLISPVLAGKV